MLASDVEKFNVARAQHTEARSIVDMMADSFKSIIGDHVTSNSQSASKRTVRFS